MYKVELETVILMVGRGKQDLIMRKIFFEELFRFVGWRGGEETHEGSLV